MNVNVKPKAFQKRKPSPIAAQATASSETFIRFVATKAAGLLGQDEGKFASIKWPADRRLHGVIRASAEPPTDLSNTPALAVMGTDFVESLQPISAAARLFRASRLMLNFDRLGAIAVPDLFGIDEGPPAWVESGQPAPVGELTANATILQPFKLEFIVTVTREMILGSNAERLLGDALRAKIAFDLDKTLFDALPEDAARPAGLRSYNARLPESNWTSGNDVAMMRDVRQLDRRGRVDRRRRGFLPDCPVAADRRHAADVQDRATEPRPAALGRLAGPAGQRAPVRRSARGPVGDRPCRGRVGRERHG